ncbi:MAG: hypothetical protein NVV70_16750 [Cellulomonas sp.]|nr:hypothetical protein [Cellulomonas sp.]MCR6649695.1 hypothetical protein [Cellulomonas sp.]
MPDRRQPGSAWFALAYALAAAAGLVGLLAQPSVSVREVLAETHIEWAVLVWSLGFLIAGAGATIARWRAWYQAEVRAVYALAGMFWLWTAMVAAAGSGSAWQAGVGFAASGSFMVGWARYRLYRLRRNARSHEALAAAVGEVIEQGRAV